jgi:hypothetical protein
MSGKQKEHDHTEPEELDCTFADETGRKWFPRLTLPIVDRYCREQGLKFEDFSILTLNAAQLVDLAFYGTRYATAAKADPETREQFLERLDGPSYQEAIFSAQKAVVNFTLRSQLPKQQRQRASRLLAQQIATAQAASAQMLPILLDAIEAGPGTPSSAAAPMPAASPETTSASGTSSPLPSTDNSPNGIGPAA